VLELHPAGNRECQTRDAVGEASVFSESQGHWRIGRGLQPGLRLRETYDLGGLAQPLTVSPCGFPKWSDVVHSSPVAVSACHSPVGADATVSWSSLRAHLHTVAPGRHLPNLPCHAIFMLWH
jgi:hypothetical protein